MYNPSGLVGKWIEYIQSVIGANEQVVFVVGGEGFDGVAIEVLYPLQLTGGRRVAKQIAFGTNPDAAIAPIFEQGIDQQGAFAR